MKSILYIIQIQDALHTLYINVYINIAIEFNVDFHV